MVVRPPQLGKDVLEPPLPALLESWQKRERELWVNEMLSDCIEIKLNDKNGKESIDQWFWSEPTL